MIINKRKTRRISANIQSFEKEIIKIFIKGAVYAFCNNYNGKFSVMCLFGKDNRDWNDTPLQLIYDYYRLNGKTQEQSAKQAAKDIGILLKEVLCEDKMFLYEEYNNYKNEYRRLSNKELAEH